MKYVLLTQLDGNGVELWPNIKNQIDLKFDYPIYYYNVDYNKQRQSN